jgi:hypothetical protein
MPGAPPKQWRPGCRCERWGKWSPPPDYSEIRYLPVPSSPRTTSKFRNGYARGHPQRRSHDAVGRRPVRGGRRHCPGDTEPPQVPQRAELAAARCARRGAGARHGGRCGSCRAAARGGGALLLGARSGDARAAGRLDGAGDPGGRDRVLRGLSQVQPRLHAEMAEPAQAHHRRGAGLLHLRWLDDRRSRSPGTSTRARRSSWRSRAALSRRRMHASWAL